MIPAEAVEAAAKAFYATEAQPMYDESKEQFTGARPWEWLTERSWEAYREKARQALEAAAPHMLKSAYDLGFKHGSNEPAAEPLSSEVARRACAEPVWDGPYKMTCGHIIVRGKCVRHGENGATYEIRTGPNAR